MAFILISAIAHSNGATRPAVHCAIIGFGAGRGGEKIIFDGNKISAAHISPYFFGATDIFIESRGTPLCDMPETMTGNRPADGGNLTIEGKELANLIKANLLSEKYIRQFMGSEEFINNKNGGACGLCGETHGTIQDISETLKMEIRGILSIGYATAFLVIFARMACNKLAQSKISSHRTLSSEQARMLLPPTCPIYLIFGFDLPCNTRTPDLPFGGDCV